jgi:hypothetical protein
MTKSPGKQHKFQTQWMFRCCQKVCSCSSPQWKRNPILYLPNSLAFKCSGIFYGFLKMSRRLHARYTGLMNLLIGTLPSDVPPLQGAQLLFLCLLTTFLENTHGPWQLMLVLSDRFYVVIVQKLYAFSRNYTSNFKFWYFPGLMIRSLKLFWFRAGSVTVKVNKQHCILQWPTLHRRDAYTCGPICTILMLLIETQYSTNAIMFLEFMFYGTQVIVYLDLIK